MVLVECFSQVYVSWYSECPPCPQAYQYLNNSFEPPYKTPSCCWGYPDYTDFLLLGNDWEPPRLTWLKAGTQHESARRDSFAYKACR